MRKLDDLKAEVEDVLKNNILPFWINKMVDVENEGFYGQITGKDETISQARKGSVLNSRILWTFSAAYRVFKNPDYLAIATRAKNYIIDYFIDNNMGGVFWLLDYAKNPIETKKQIYAQGFTIYGLSEYYRVTNDNEALKIAIDLYQLIEEYSFDSKKNGYLEAFTQDWQIIDDMRLSEKDANEQKTMNTHLHILEAYTNLYRVWKNESLRNQLRNLIEIFLEKIIDTKTGHLRLFFDTDWSNKSCSVSFGHDIEASWLLYEAASILNDTELLEKVRKIVPLIVRTSEEGLLPDGSMMYEKNIDTVHQDTERHWWVQAETVIGFLNHYHYFGDKKSLHIAMNCWDYIKNNLIDHTNGEWFWSIYPDGSVNRNDDKAGIWKCPYHNGRMCLEIIERF